MAIQTLRVENKARHGVKSMVALNLQDFIIFEAHLPHVKIVAFSVWFHQNLGKNEMLF